MKRPVSFSTDSYFFALISIGILILIVLPACEEKSDEVNGEVELFLLESYDTMDQTCAINSSSVELKNSPLIAYSELKSYNSDRHVFKISDGAKKVVESLEHSVNGLAFALLANDQLIYTGYFWPGYSSASCEWIVIDPLMIQGDNELRVELGYPGLTEGTEIPDERNNSLILDIFERDGKLVN